MGELSSLPHVQPSWLASQPPEPWGVFQSLQMRTVNLLPLPRRLRSPSKLKKQNLPSELSYPKSAPSPVSAWSLPHWIPNRSGHWKSLSFPAP